jgi:hypothetical protein
MKEYPIIRMSVPVKPEELEQAYKDGMLRKDQLVDQKYYAGDCRNASCARWDAKTERFTYMRYKFGQSFPEEINHPADDDSHDLFTPFEEIEPEAHQVIVD